MRRVLTSTHIMSSSLVMICLFTSQACAKRFEIPLFSSTPLTVSQNQAQPSYPMYGAGNQGMSGVEQMPQQMRGMTQQQSVSQPFQMPPQPQPQLQQPQYQRYNNPYQQNVRKPAQSPNVTSPAAPAGNVNPYTNLMKEAQQCVDVAMEINDTAYYLETAKKSGKYFIPVLSSNLEFLKRLFTKFRCERWYGYNTATTTSNVEGGGQSSVGQQKQEGKQPNNYDYNTYLNVDGY